MNPLKTLALASIVTLALAGGTARAEGVPARLRTQEEQIDVLIRRVAELERRATTLEAQLAAAQGAITTGAQALAALQGVIAIPTGVDAPVGGGAQTPPPTVITGALRIDLGAGKAVVFDANGVRMVGLDLEVGLGLQVDGSRIFVANGASPPTLPLVTAPVAPVVDLVSLLQPLSRRGDELHITGVNVHIENGDPTAAYNGVGNLILGYNKSRAVAGEQDIRIGSHYLVTGDFNNYSGAGGIIGGFRNNIAAFYSSIVSGHDNLVMGGVEDLGAAILGGSHNRAAGLYSTISGGVSSTTFGLGASICGGAGNLALGENSSVSGGVGNTARAVASSVSGGEHVEPANVVASWAAAGFHSP